MQFSKPGSTSDMFALRDYVDELILFQPLELTEVNTIYAADTPMVVCNITVLTGPDEGKQIASAGIFNKLVLGQMKTELGNNVLGRVGRGKAKAGQDAPFLIVDPTKQDLAIAEKFFAPKRGSKAAAPDADQVNEEDIPF